MIDNIKMVLIVIFLGCAACFWYFKDITVRKFKSFFKNKVSFEGDIEVSEESKRIKENEKRIEERKKMLGEMVEDFNKEMEEVQKEEDVEKLDQELRNQW